MKISIIGNGVVGSTLAYSILSKSLCDNLVISSRNMTKVEGDVLDLNHAMSFCEKPMKIVAECVDDVKQSDIVILTCSVPNNGSLTSRMDLRDGNVKLFKTLIPNLVSNNRHAIYIVATNPVDIMTYVTTVYSGLNHKKVLGVGTLVDSARFRFLLSKKLKVHPDDIRAYILGEHGDFQFPLLSNFFVGGYNVCSKESYREIFNEVIKAGFEVYNKKGYTNYAVVNAITAIVESIAYNENRTMPIATYFDKWGPYHHNCYSIPVVVGRDGINNILTPCLSDEEVFDADRNDIHMLSMLVNTFDYIENL